MTGGLPEACDYLRRVGIELGEPKTWVEFIRALDAATATASGKGGSGQEQGDPDSLNFVAGKTADLSHDSYGRRLDSNGIPISRPTRHESAALAEQEHPLGHVDCRAAAGEGVEHDLARLGEQPEQVLDHLGRHPAEV